MKAFKVSIKPLVGEEETREYTIDAEDEKTAKDLAMQKLLKREEQDALLDSPAQMLTAEEIDTKPKKISDLLDNIDFYVSEMRKAGDLDTIPENLKAYALDYFNKVELNDEALRALALYTMDKAYRVSAYIEIFDNYTRAYYAKVIPYIWDYLHGRGLSIFYILDNTFYEDGRFEVVVELFKLTGIGVVVPYNKDGAATFESVEEQIRNFMEKKLIIMYIEKDSSVNYLDKIKSIAIKSDYLCIFRNKSFANPHVEILPNEK